MRSQFLGYCLHAFAAHHTTDTAYDQQHNVIEHFGKGLIHGGHGLQWLDNECQAIQHERHDASQDQRDNDYDETPDTGLKFFSGQTTLLVRVRVLVEQFASPIQVLQGNLGSLV
jgi:hypothetical protein